MLKDYLKKRPIFLFLLPLFFVLHGFNQNYGFVEPVGVATLILIYYATSIIICGFFFIFSRGWLKASLITSIGMSVFFFYGAFHDFIKAHFPHAFFSRYSFLLPTILLVLIIFFFVVKKTERRLHQFTFFLNLLLTVYIIFDIAGIAKKGITPNSDNKLSVYDFAKDNIYTLCDSCEKPDIYFILLDEYASSRSLKQRFNYNNTFDSFLVRKGFSIQTSSRSNYNLTLFSVSSILNMQYLYEIGNVNAITIDDYMKCNMLIKKNEVIKFLSVQGYDIVNYSVFNMAGYPTAIEQSFLPLGTRVITDGTLFARLVRDFGWWFRARQTGLWFLPKKNFFGDLMNNKKLIDLTKLESAKKMDRPRFVYTHLYFPHFPYFFDAKGNVKDTLTVYNEFKNNSPAAYLDYLTGGNPKIEEMINVIQKNTNSKAIIIIMGDHGYRNAKELNKDYFFQNMNAIYFPDKEYRLLYDSISCVNQFRVVFNKLFNQKFPLLRDSSTFLIEKK